MRLDEPSANQAVPALSVVQHVVMHLVVVVLRLRQYMHSLPTSAIQLQRCLNETQAKYLSGLRIESSLYNTYAA